MSTSQVPRESPVSPKTVRHVSSVDQPAPRRSSAQPASGGARRKNSTPSGAVVQSAESQAHNTPTTTPRQQRKDSGGVLGLPSVVDPALLDDIFDLTAFINETSSSTNNVLDPNTLEWVSFDALGAPATTTADHSHNQEANQLRYTTDFLNDDPTGFLGCLTPVKGPPNDFLSTDDIFTPDYSLSLAPAAGHEPRDALFDPSSLIDPTLLDFGYYDGSGWSNNSTTAASLPLAPTQSTYNGTTPGLSALPGGMSSFIPGMALYPGVDSTQHAYSDPYAALYPTEPYYPFTQQQQQPQYYTGYVPTLDDKYGTTEQYSIVPQSRSRRSSREYGQSTVQSVSKRKRSAWESDSEDDARIRKRYRGSRASDASASVSASSGPSRQHSLTSDDGSVTRPVKNGVVKPGQKPKKCEDKPWVRINNTTKGETTRTARINQHTEEGRKYRVKNLPFGDWESTHYTFEYSHNNSMHEFRKRTMSARQIHEYITQYPGDNLRIWIQPVASDSARRYASASHSHCRFEKCPMRKYTGKGTAEVGNYRVAFDEKHKTYGAGVVDPYDCVGYAHLYCMERFLDFAYICQVADVRVDQRVSMEKEPRGHFASAFGSKHHHEAALAKKFIDAARKGWLGDTHEFSNYPVHEEYARGEPKPHERTLIYALYGMNIKHRAKSQMKQFILQRTIRPGSFPVHKGDMEVKLVDKKIERLPAFKDFLKKGSKKDFDYSAYYDQFHPEIKQRIAECMALREQFMAEDEIGVAAPRRPRTRRRRQSVDESEEEMSASRKKHNNKRTYLVIDSDSSDDETRASRQRSRKGKAAYQDDFSDEDDFEEIGSSSSVRQTHSQTSASRRSLRQRPRVNYTEPQDTLWDISEEQQQQPPAIPAPGYQPASSNYLDARKASCSNLFPENNDSSWKTLELDSLPVDQNAPTLTQEEIDALMAAHRRKSSTLSNGPWLSAIKSLKSRRASSSSSFVRRASFNVQPVSSSKRFRLDDPPARVGDS